LGWLGLLFCFGLVWLGFGFGLVWGCLEFGLIWFGVVWFGLVWFSFNKAVCGDPQQLTTMLNTKFRHFCAIKEDGPGFFAHQISLFIV
jgi:hypothetical protein